MDFSELGAWDLSTSTTVPLSTITNNESVLEGYCRMNPDDPICNQEKSNLDFLGLILSGVGVFTKSPILIGGGLLLAFIRGRSE